MFIRPIFGKKGKKVKEVKSYLTEPEDEGIPESQYLPKSPAEWWRDPSAKIDYLREIVEHHLSEDNSLPFFAIQDHRPVIASITNIPHEALKPRSPGLPCDKILIYSAFPLNNELIIHVLGLFGRIAVQINGSMSAKNRSAALRQFKESTVTQGPRILIISNVGTVGLNIPEANILIQMVRLWR